MKATLEKHDEALAWVADKSKQLISKSSMEDTLSRIINELTVALQTPAAEWSALPRSIAALVLIALALIVYHLTRRLLIRLTAKVLARKHPIWSRFLQERRLIGFVAFLAAILVVYVFLPRLLAGHSELSLDIYLILNLLIITTLALPVPELVV